MTAVDDANDIENDENPDDQKDADVSFSNNDNPNIQFGKSNDTKSDEEAGIETIKVVQGKLTNLNLAFTQPEINAEIGLIVSGGEQSVLSLNTINDIQYGGSDESTFQLEGQASIRAKISPIDSNGEESASSLNTNNDVISMVQSNETKTPAENVATTSKQCVVRLNRITGKENADSAHCSTKKSKQSTSTVTKATKRVCGPSSFMNIDRRPKLRLTHQNDTENESVHSKRTIVPVAL